MSLAAQQTINFRDGLRTFTMKPSEFTRIGDKIPRSLKRQFYERKTQKPRSLNRPPSDYRYRSVNNTLASYLDDSMIKKSRLTSNQLRLLVNSDNKVAMIRTEYTLNVQNLQSMKTISQVPTRLNTSMSVIKQSHQSDGHETPQLAKSVMKLLEESRIQQEKIDREAVMLMGIKNTVKFSRQKSVYQHFSEGESIQKSLLKRHHSNSGSYSHSNPHRRSHSKIHINNPAKLLKLEYNPIDNDSSLSSEEHIKHLIQGISNRSLSSVYNEIEIFPDFTEQSAIITTYIQQTMKMSMTDPNTSVKQMLKMIPAQVKDQYSQDINEWYPLSRINKFVIKNQLEDVYGKDKYRWLYPSEEALVIQTIMNLLDECFRRLEMLGQSVQKILTTLLQQSRMESLSRFPVCMKQIECHWKLLATKFRCSKSMDFNDKHHIRAIQAAQQRGHFLDMTRTENLLVQYLWKHSSAIVEDTLDG